MMNHLRKTLTAGLTALVLASCGQATVVRSARYAELVRAARCDESEKHPFCDEEQREDESIAESQLRLLKELNYAHEGVQANQKVVRCGVGMDYFDERRVEFDIRVEYARTIPVAAQKSGIMNRLRNISDRTGTFCIEYPVTFEEMEERRMAKLSPEERTKEVCSSTFEKAKERCNYTPEGIGFKRCDADANMLKEKVSVECQLEYCGDCGIPCTYSLLDETGVETDRRWRDHGWKLTPAEREACGINAKAKAYQKNEAIEKTRQECVKPFQQTYDLCLEAAQRVFLACPEKK